MKKSLGARTLIFDTSHKGFQGVGPLLGKAFSSGKGLPIMSTRIVTPLDRTLARLCELCPVCRLARHRQKGVAYAIVKNIEVSICPFCQAYERVHGRKAHESIERDNNDNTL